MTALSESIAVVSNFVSAVPDHADRTVLLVLRGSVEARAHAGARGVNNFAHHFLSPSTSCDVCESLWHRQIALPAAVPVWLACNVQVIKVWVLANSSSSTTAQHIIANRWCSTYLNTARGTVFFPALSSTLPQQRISSSKINNSNTHSDWCASAGTNAAPSHECAHLHVLL